MVAVKALMGGKKKHHKKHSHGKKLGAKKAKKTVSVPKHARYVKPGSKAIAKDPLHKCGPTIKSGKHAGMCKVVLSKQGQKVRASMLARKGSKKKRK